MKPMTSNNVEPVLVFYDTQELRDAFNTEATEKLLADIAAHNARKADGRINEGKTLEEFTKEWEQRFKNSK